MSKDENIVITVYGHDNEIDKIAVISYGQNNESKADAYCYTVNNLKLEGKSWIFARTISENIQYALEEFLPLKFDIILKLDDRSIQKVLREVDSYLLIMALKGESEVLCDKIFSNVSKRAEEMLREDMDYMGPVRIQNVREAQEKILKIIQHLEKSGEITISYSKGDIVK